MRDQTPPVHWTQRQGREKWTKTAAVVFGAGSLLAVLAPWNTHTLGWPLVWVYWVGLIATGYLCTTAAVWFVRKLGLRARPLVLNLIDGALASLPITAVVLGVNRVLDGRPTDVSDWPITYFYVAVITAAMITLGELIARASHSTVSHRNQDAIVAQFSQTPPFLERLSPKLQSADLLAISSEDHYLRVHTSRGDELVLMRLRDAINEVSRLDGLQVHRSWWVARSAVKTIRRGDGRMRLTLSNGLSVPVSRTYAPAVRKAGWTAGDRPTNAE